MTSSMRLIWANLFSVDPQERLKVIYLGIIFFLIIAGYTAAKDLKDSVFLTVVGKDFQPYAKYVAMCVLMPFILIYSRIVDTQRRSQVLVLCSAFFGIGGIIFSYFIGHQTIGLPNTTPHWHRLFGWLFYCFVEGYSPFVLSVYWAFANSITNPEAAKKNYGLMVSASKAGGLLSAGLAWALFSWSSAIPDYAQKYDIFNHQLVLALSSLCFLLVPWFVWRLMKKVPGHLLHGYEVLYQLEKQRKSQKTGILKGLIMLLRYPYVLGIFGMVFFYEAVFQVISYLRLSEALAQSNSVSGLSSCLFQATCLMHAVALAISLFGTRPLLQFFGERICLLLIPLISGIFVIFLMFDVAPYAVSLAFVMLKSVNFAFFWPVRESLYIPAIKEIKFKAKSWIDAFGSKFAKSAGATFNALFLVGALRPGIEILSLFFVPVLALWAITAYLLGHRYEQAIQNNEVIGQEELGAHSKA